MFVGLRKVLFIEFRADFIKKALPLNVVFILRKRFKFSQQLFLLAVQAARGFYNDRQQIIAAVFGVDLHDAAVFDAEHRAALHALRNRILERAFQTGHFNCIAKGCLCECNRNGAAQVAALPREEFVPANANCDQQVAARTAVGTLIALTAQDNSLVVVDTGRNFDRDRPASANLTHAVTGRARVLDLLSFAAAIRADAGCADGSKRGAARCTNLTGAVTGAARFHFAALGCAAAVAIGTFFHAVHRDIF